jgi:hypothetical protein
MIRDFQKGCRTRTIDDFEAVRRALEAKGVKFIAEIGVQPDVRLGKGDGVIRATWDPPTAP